MFSVPVAMAGLRAEAPEFQPGSAVGASTVHSRLESHRVEAGLCFALAQYSGLKVETNVFFDDKGQKEDNTGPLENAQRFMFQVHRDNIKSQEMSQMEWRRLHQHLVDAGFQLYADKAQHWWKDTSAHTLPPQPLSREGVRLHEIDMVVIKEYTPQQNEELPCLAFRSSAVINLENFAQDLGQTTLIEVMCSPELTDRKWHQLRGQAKLASKIGGNAIVLFNGSEACSVDIAGLDNIRAVWFSKENVLSFEKELWKKRAEKSEQKAEIAEAEIAQLKQRLMTMQEQLGFEHEPEAGK